MLEETDPSEINRMIDKLTKEAAEIRKRYASSDSEERKSLEARYCQLELELNTIKSQLREPSPLIVREAHTSGRDFEAGPFGISMGMPIEMTWPDAKEFAPGLYMLRTVPTPHPTFGTYYVGGTIGTGVAYINATGKKIRTNVYGTELQDTFWSMRGSLARKYGERYDTIDELRPGSIWSEDRDWMAALSKNERVLSARWDATKLPNGLAAINLVASAVGDDDEYGRLTLSYFFKNFCDFDREKDELGANSVL